MMTRFAYSATRCLIGLALALCAAVLVPNTAHAWFNDVTDSYPASQEVTTGGDVLTAADIPEGQYGISASSSSYMCKITNVTLTSVGGELWVTFNLSKAYNALYPGSAEEAAAATNSEGTDASNYYITEPFEGYVDRQFSILIDALNQPMPLATYSGGSKGLEDGLWYSRTVSFNSSSEVMAAVEAAKNPPAEQEQPSEQSQEQETGQDPGQEGTTYENETSDTQDVQGESEQDLPQDASEPSDGAEAKDPKDEEKSSEASPTSAPAAAPAAPKQSDNPGTGNPAGQSEEQSSEEQQDSNEAQEASSQSAASKSAESAQSAAASKKTGRMGTALSFVGDEVKLENVERPDVDRPDRPDEADAESGGLAAVAAIVFMNVALAAVLVLGIRRLYAGRLGLSGNALGDAA